MPQKQFEDKGSSRIMDIKYYNDYLKFKSQGLKKQATDSIREFIQSFATQQEIEEWVWT